MAFAVFRRHQRKLLAIFAILAMFGFVLADSLPRLMQGSGPSMTDPVVVELYGQPVKQSELNRMAQEKSRVIRFLSAVLNVSPEMIQQGLFGGLSTRELVDSLILEREADQLGMPATPAMAKQWLAENFKDRVDGRLLAQVYNQQFRNEVTDEQLLTELANQIRLTEVLRLAGAPLVSPLDVYQSFRDQRELVSVNAVAFPVEDFLKDVPEPKEDELRAFYDRYKDREANPAVGEPGFTVPRRATAEFVTVDGHELGLTATDAEVQARYEREKAAGQFKLPPLKALPDDVFAADESADAVHTAKADWDTGEPAERFRPLEEVRPLVEEDIIKEKVQAAADAKLEPIRKLMNAYANDRVAAIADREEDGSTAATPEMPQPPDVKAAAAQAGLAYDSTPPLTREQAEKYGQIADARLGLGRSARDIRFGDWLFLDQTELFEPTEMTDGNDRFYLVWKTKDLAPEVPAFKDIRDEVAAAWKLDKARPLALKAAQDLAARAKQENGDLRLAAGERGVITTTPVSRLQPTPPQFAQLGMNMPPMPNDIAPLQGVGEELRSAVFDPDAEGVRVAPNQPKTIYYVLAASNRVPATFENLYQPFGERTRLMGDVRNDAARQNALEWMNYLRGRARLDPSWVPPEEANARGRNVPAEL